MFFAVFTRTYHWGFADVFYLVSILDWGFGNYLRAWAIIALMQFGAYFSSHEMRSGEEPTQPLTKSAKKAFLGRSLGLPSDALIHLHLLEMTHQFSYIR